MIDGRHGLAVNSVVEEVSSEGGSRLVSVGGGARHVTTGVRVAVSCAPHVEPRHRERRILAAALARTTHQGRRGRGRGSAMSAKRKKRDKREGRRGALR